MVFWSTADAEPTRQFRFKVLVGAETWWWAKSVTKPSFTISSVSRKLYGIEYIYPEGIPEWNDVTMHIVDVGGKSKKLYDILGGMGWSPDGTGQGISKTAAQSALGGGVVEIHQLDKDGEAVEKWKLHDPWIHHVDFGELNYSSDELVSITIHISYGYATIED